jgi:hypothetical protein
MKLFLILAVYSLSVATIIAFMMGASRKEKQWYEDHK